MQKKKISLIILGAVISNMVMTPMTALAAPGEDLVVSSSATNEEKTRSTEASIKKFSLYGNENLGTYDEAFKIKRSEITSISNNGGKYASSTLDKAFDNNMSTHFETGTQNSTSFTNEIVVTFDEAKVLDRVVYAARQDGAKGKGFARNIEIYASVTDNEDDFTLAATGVYTGSTGDLVEIKFDAEEFKRLKFVFKEAVNSWASASELWFYEEDKVLDIMNDLFKDSSKYEIKDEYNNIDTINELKESIVNHPFRDLYIDDLKLAKEVINDGKLAEAKDSKILVSQIAQSKNIAAYDEIYKVNTSEFKKVTSNGGHYGQSVLTKLYDNDKTTHWETGKSNSDTFKNEVEFTFNSIQEIGRIIMTPRPGASNKGFPLKYEVYGSLNEDSSDYRLIASGSSSSVLASDFEITFDSTKFKKLKFKFVDAYNGMAGLGEMSFYREDTLSTEIGSVFADNLHTMVNEKYNSLEKIAELEALLESHPLKNDYMSIIESAKSIINQEEAAVSKVITLSQRGDENVQRAERRQIFAGGNVDVTGYYIMPGETFEVYLDADSESILPQLVFSQVGDVDGAGNHRRSLSVGRNVLTAPSGTKGFAIYFANKALPEQQAYAPNVKLLGENLKSYPVYIHGKTDPKEYIEAVKNHTGANMTDVMGERYLLSAKNSEAKIAYVDRGYSPDKTNADMEKVIASFDSLAGYDVNDENPIHRPSKALYHYKATNTSGLYASNEYIHYSAESARSMFSGAVYGWGFVHEFGHQIENQDMRLLEVTNNIYSTYTQKKFSLNEANLTGSQNTVDKFIMYNEGSKGFGGFGVQYDFTLGLFERLVVLNQVINYFGEDAYAKANRLMRENLSRYNSTGSYQSLITSLSEATGYDLSPHFEFYNYPVTDATKKFTSQFKVLDKKLQYITMNDYNKQMTNVNTFAEDTKAVISDIKRNADGFTLSLNTSNNNQALTIYEIYRDGEFVGISRNNTYKDTVDSSKEYNYEVVAYDYRVNESIKSDTVNTEISYRPTINVNADTVIAKGENFNPLEYVKASKFDGEVINAEDIRIIKNNVDNKNQGTYEVVFEVEDRNNVVTKSMEVTVVSRYDYLSDTEWTSVKTQWGTPRRNSNIQGRLNGEIVSFDKGFGIHANGEIVYNLGEHNYDTFTALVGVDMTIAAQNNSSIKFKVYVDGEVVETTNVLKHSDDMVYIKVPVNGAKEIKIEIDNAGNGNTSDHAVIANPKLTTNNSMPRLEIADDVVLKMGQSIDDVMGRFTASDIEDGNLSGQVIVEGQDKVDFTKPGTYKISYTVTDTDGNKVQKTRNIFVVNMKEHTYLSDVQYKSASQSWNTLKKDTAVSGNSLRLTNEANQEVTYEKGLGTHSTSTIVYDLTGSDYQVFTSYIGVDRTMYNSVGSVVFEVYVDGVKAYESGLMKAKDAQKFVEVNIANAKELKLVVKDGGNGNGSDHANWADAKLHSAASNIDKTSLNNIISEIENMDASKYTEESFNSLISVKNQVIEVLKNGYSVEDINSAVTKLNAAKEALVNYVSPKRLELNNLLQYADTIDKSMASDSNFLEVRWYNFDIFRNVAKEAMADETKSEDELVSIIFTLNYFIEELGIK